MRLTTPVPVEVTAHPWLPDRFTHVIRQRDARARGWHFYGDTAWGVWRSKTAARRAALRLQDRGIVTLRGALA